MSVSMYMGTLLAAADAIGKDCQDANLAFVLVRFIWNRKTYILMQSCTTLTLRFSYFWCKWSVLAILLSNSVQEANHGSGGLPQCRQPRHILCCSYVRTLCPTPPPP